MCGFSVPQVLTLCLCTLSGTWNVTLSEKMYFFKEPRWLETPEELCGRLYEYYIWIGVVILLCCFFSLDFRGRWFFVRQMTLCKYRHWINNEKISGIMLFRFIWARSDEFGQVRPRGIKNSVYFSGRNITLHTCLFWCFYFVNVGESWLCGRKTLRLLCTSISFSFGIAYFVFIWGQRTKYATGKVPLGFKQLTKWGSITGAAVSELEIGRFDEACRSHIQTFRKGVNMVKWASQWLCLHCPICEISCSASGIYCPNANCKMNLEYNNACN
jgi:hypothetical protein